MITSPLYKGLGLASGMNAYTGEDPDPYIGGRGGRLDRIADVRDYVANLVGFGPKTSNKEVSADFGQLVSIFGKPTAEKLLNHIFVFNNRPDIQKANPEERLRAFYTIGSRDPVLSRILTDAKAFYQGPIAGLYESHNQGSQILSKRFMPAPIKRVPGIVQSTSDKFQ